jgi:hypothetical protein
MTVGASNTTRLRTATSCIKLIIGDLMHRKFYINQKQFMPLFTTMILNYLEYLHQTRDRIYASGSLDRQVTNKAMCI